MKLSPDAITSLLTSLFPSGMIDDLAREREVVVRERKLDVRVLVWTLSLWASPSVAKPARLPDIAAPTTVRPDRICFRQASTIGSPRNWNNSCATSSTTLSRRSLSPILSLLPSSSSTTWSSPTPLSCGCIGFSQRSLRHIQMSPV